MSPELREIEQCRAGRGGARRREPAHRVRAARVVGGRCASTAPATIASAVRRSRAAAVVVVEVVAEVAAHDDERLGAAPDGVEHRGDVPGLGAADDEREEPEVAERPLQERQVHLEAVLGRVRASSSIDDAGHGERDGGASSSSMGTSPSGVREGVGAAHREAVDTRT